MTDLERVQAFLSTADEDTLTNLESTIDQTRAARIAARSDALPEYPTLVSLDVPGHKAGVCVEVCKTRAIELLTARTHRLANLEELAASRKTA